MRLSAVVSLLLILPLAQFTAAATEGQRAKLVVHTGHSGIVMSAAFSPDGKLLASGGYDKSVRLWDVATSTEVYALAGHLDSVTSVAFSPDGKTLASGGWDKNTKLWDVATGNEIATLIALDASDWVVTTPEGRFDTSQSLDRIEGLHWIVNDEILKPLPLDVFMRQYYEPGLLRRAVGCGLRQRVQAADLDRGHQPRPAESRLERDQTLRRVGRRGGRDGRSRERHGGCERRRARRGGEDAAHVRGVRPPTLPRRATRRGLDAER